MNLSRGSLSLGFTAYSKMGVRYAFCDWRHYAQVEAIFKTIFNLKQRYYLG
jgi:hypothetical protein